MLLAMLSGLSAGLIHVLSGPDHLAAVAPLSIPAQATGWRVGWRWGLGHCGGVGVVALLALVLRGVLPLGELAAVAERGVGWLLVLIGLWGLRRLLRRHVHTHVHTHDGESHVHIHVHETGNHSLSAPHASHRHTHTAFAIGTLHGVAGSSHFLAVLPALAFPSLRQAVAYLLFYGVGTIAAMMAFSAMMAGLGRASAARGLVWYRALTATSSFAAILVGGWWLLS